MEAQAPDGSSNLTNGSHVETEIAQLLAPTASLDALPHQYSHAEPHPHVGGKTLTSILAIASLATGGEEHVDPEAPGSQLLHGSQDARPHSSYGGKTLSAILSYANQLPGSQESNTDSQTTSLSVEAQSLPENRPTVGGKSISLVTAHAPPPYEAFTLSVVPENPAVPDYSTDAKSAYPDDPDDSMSTSSELSYGEDLKADLEDVLVGDFDFQGEFAFSSVLPQAPNPGLHIDGLGLIGLPLSHRDAQFIKETSIQAPYGKGTQTVVDKNVRDTWEIDPQRIQFTNPAWKPYIDGTVVDMVRKALGAAVPTTPPRCELYKLLLYETGSHFLPHQDTEKSKGMFATIIVVLPSQYSGGQVHLTHGPSQKIFDPSSSSTFTTSVLAWYTDVYHEVKPVTSGFRLALSYNLIHTSSSIPPSIPNMTNAVANVSHIFHKWAAGKYSRSQDKVAFLLDHEYSEHNLKTTALKGKDAHLIAQLRGPAEEANIMLCLANLELHITGCADDDGHSYYKRNRCYYDDRESGSEDPGMLDEISRSLELEKVVTLKGIPFLDSLPLENEALIPEDPFEDASPDETEYEGYMGNGAGELQYWYRRTVLLMFPREHEEELMLAGQGVEYAIAQLQKTTTTPTAKERRMFQFVMDRLKVWDAYRWRAPTVNSSAVRALARATLAWNDLKLWISLTGKGGANQNIGVLGIEHLLAARKKFGSEKVSVTLQQFLESLPFQSRVELLKSLYRDAPEGEQVAVIEWCDKQVEAALKTLKQPNVADGGALVELGVLRGLGFVVESIIPQLAKSSCPFDFWTAFIPTLHKNREVLMYSTASLNAEGNGPLDAKEVYLHLLTVSLQMAFSQWKSVYQQYGSRQSSTKMIDLISSCLDIGRVDLISDLLSDIAKEGRNSSPNVLTSTILPLLVDLRSNLTRRTINICSPPFVNFFRLAVGLYMRDVLGPKPDMSNVLQLRKVGCGCADCSSLDAFLSSRTTRQHTFRMGQGRRGHLGNLLRQLGNMVTMQTIYSGSPHGLSVTKAADSVIAASWKMKQSNAKTFLTSLGDEALLRTLLGSEREAVTKAIDGSLPITSIASFDAYRSTTSSGPPRMDTSAAASTSVSGPSMPHGTAATPTIAQSSLIPALVPHPVGGQKRRKGIISTTDVIDLTLE
ncbi:hypothetical protein BDN67DRAFT_962852 [Paxillus ammoniavirescens]|nr:hypothetical protein BDN67DRAFT_962852 [Paxillus ammoniavirescens]